MRIVLDTNCLIMAISSKNRYNIIWKSFLGGKFFYFGVLDSITFPHVDVVGIDTFVSTLL